MKNFELQHVLASGFFGRENAQARQLRGESTADWLAEAFDRLYIGKDVDEDIKATSATVAGHTVESFVEDLRKRVQLDSLSKTAAVKIPLSKIGKHVDLQKSLADMAAFLTTYHIRPSHALKGSEALFHELKEQFGAPEVQSLGRDTIMKMIHSLLEQQSEPNLADGLPTYDGTPIPSASQEDQSVANQIGKAKV